MAKKMRRSSGARQRCPMQTETLPSEGREFSRLLPPALPQNDLTVLSIYGGTNILLKSLARPKRFELLTPRFVVCRSILFQQESGGIMPETSPLLKWLIEQFAEQDDRPPRRCLEELAAVAKRLSPLVLGRCPPLRRSLVAKKLAVLSNNLARAAKAAAELGEEGLSQVLLASETNRPVELSNTLGLLAHLQDLAMWSERAADSAKDNKGGPTPDVRLRSLVTILADRYQSLLGIKPTHTVNPDTGLGHSTFDLFIKETLRTFAPKGLTFEPSRVDTAISWAIAD
jgi:hypothetical protein